MKGKKRSSIGALAVIGTATGLACTAEVDAVRICGDESSFDLSGTIVNTRVDITFTASGSFDAANLGLSIGLPVNGAGAGLGFARPTSTATAASGSPT